MNLTTEALTILILLAPGFLAFRILMIDADWQAVKDIDKIFGSIVFCAVGYLVFLLVSKASGIEGDLAFAGITLVSAPAVAIAWKGYGHKLFHNSLRSMKITNEDNQGTSWEKIFNDPRVYVRQVTAYLKSGEAVECDDTVLYDRPTLRKLGMYPYYAHRNGQISFIFNRRRKGKEEQFISVPDVEVDGWGFRVVYVNPAELERLELRLGPSGAANQEAKPARRHRRL